MGATKTGHYTKHQKELSGLMKALGHPARIAILEYLLSVDKCICGDIVKELSLAQPTISQHLRELKNVGFIKGEVEGTAICYCIDENIFAKLQYFTTLFLEKIKIKNSKCC